MAARRRGGHRQSGRAACSGAVDLGRPVLPRLPGSQPRAGRAGRWRPFPGAWRIGRLAHACYSPGRGESQMIHLKKEETKAMVAVHGWSGILLGLLLYARSEEHTAELQSLMRISYAVLCLKRKNN